jgi:YD repeat-containing protein
VTGYLIQRCAGTGCTNFSQLATSSTTGFTDAGLTSSTAYGYEVQASDGAGNLSAFSNAASATTSSGSGGGSGAATSNYTYDAQGRLQSVSTPGGPTTHYTYDAAGHVVGIQTN